MIRNTFSVGLLFTSIEYFSKKAVNLKTNNKIWNSSVDLSVGCLSKLISIALTNPLYLLKTRAESGMIDNNHTIRQHITGLYREGGFRGMYNGFWATFIRDVPYQGIQFAIYKFLGDLVGAFKKEDTSTEPLKEKLGKYRIKI